MTSKRAKRFMVVPRTKDAKLEGFDVGRGKRSFHKRGGMFVTNEAEAQEIDATIGLNGSGKVWVHEDPMYEWHLHHDRSTKGYNIDIHRNTFGQNRTYAEAWEAFEKRRKDKQHASS